LQAAGRHPGEAAAQEAAVCRNTAWSGDLRGPH